MRLYIDCEWNSFGGELISMALVSPDGHEFYEVVEHDHLDIHPWVAENVIPILNQNPISKKIFQKKLRDFLSTFDSVEIISDWPEDIEHFCNALITGPGERLRTPPIAMRFVGIKSESKIPHNALEDATANMNAYEKFLEYGDALRAWACGPTL